MKLFIPVSPASCYYAFLTRKYFSKHPVPAQPLCLFLYKAAGEIIVLYVFSYLRFYISDGKIKYSELDGRKHSRISCAVMFVNLILICYCRFQTLYIVSTSFKDFVAVLSYVLKYNFVFIWNSKSQSFELSLSLISFW
jgi:hypothetical protein